MSEVGWCEGGISMAVPDKKRWLLVLVFFLQRVATVVQQLVQQRTKLYPIFVGAPWVFGY